MVRLSTHILFYFFEHYCSTRISNELGSGNPKAATRVVLTVMVIATIEAITLSIILFCYRSIVGYAFSNENEVVDYAKEMMPLICVSIIMDSLQAVLSGIARGTGWQHIGTYINFGSYYLFGIPLAIVLGFVLKLRGKGLWTGLVMGTTVQVIIYSFVTTFTSWEKQANMAKERIYEERLPEVDQLLS